MSAFIVNKSHINAMLLSAQSLKYSGKFGWYYNGEYRELNNCNIDEVGQMLLDECIKSVSYRYDDPISELPGRISSEYLLPFSIKYMCRMPTPIETISITNCYMYQSCEHPEWETSEAKAFCESLIKQKINQLPEYDDAPWEWEDSLYYDSPKVTRII